MKKTIEEIRDYLLENRVNEYGNLNLSCLDFSDFDGHVTIGSMKVKGNLYQNHHKVEGDLYQSFHDVQGDLLQDSQEVKGNLHQDSQKAQGHLYQYSQEVKGYLYQNSQEVKGDLFQGYQEVQGNYHSKGIKVGGDIYFDEPTKLLKEINAEELAKLGYIFKGEN